MARESYLNYYRRILAGALKLYGVEDPSQLPQDVINAAQKTAYRQAYPKELSSPKINLTRGKVINKTQTAGLRSLMQKHGVSEADMTQSIRSMEDAIELKRSLNPGSRGSVSKPAVGTKSVKLPKAPDSGRLVATGESGLSPEQLENIKRFTKATGRPRGQSQRPPRYNPANKAVKSARLKAFAAARKASRFGKGGLKALMPLMWAMDAKRYTQDPEQYLTGVATMGAGTLAPKGSLEREIQTGRIL